MLVFKLKDVRLISFVLSLEWTPPTYYTDGVESAKEEEYEVALTEN